MKIIFIKIAKVISYLLHFDNQYNTINKCLAWMNFQMDIYDIESYVE